MAAGDRKARYDAGLAAFRAGRLAEARAAFEEVLRAAPGAPEPLFQLGRCLAALGETAAAEAALRQALAARPGEAAIWQALHLVLAGPARAKLEREAARARMVLGSEADLRPALALIEAGAPERAEAEALRLARAAPMAFWPVLALGLARGARGDWAGAVAPLEAAHGRDADHRQARITLATALARTGRPRRAEALLRGAGPGRPRTEVALSRLLRETARPEDAVALLEPVAAAEARDRAVQAEMARAAGQAGDAARAMAAAARVVKMGGDRVAIHRDVALALEEAGAVPAAEACIDRALAGGPTAALLTHRAQLHQSAGDFAAAETCLHAAMDLAPTSGEVFRAYVNGRRMGAGDPVLSRLEAALARPDLNWADRAGLHFAAAKAQADLGAHDAVAPHLEIANRLVAGAHPYGFAADLAEARALVADWGRLRHLAAAGPADPVIFVTGLPRSGTTLVETILAAHPEVGAGGEMPFLGRALSGVVELLRTGGPDRPDAAGELEAELACAGRRYLRQARRRVGPAPVIADKAISTFSRMGHALAALPGARIVLVRRDPRDVGLSLWRNLFPEGLHRYAYDLAEMGRYIRLHDALVAFWTAELPGRVHVVDYEALTAAPEPAIRALLDACGLRFDPACLAPEAAGRRIQTLSFAQAREPIGTAAVAGWRRHEAALAPLIAALETEIDLAPP